MLFIRRCSVLSIEVLLFVHSVRAIAHMQGGHAVGFAHDAMGTCMEIGKAALFVKTVES